MTETKKVVNICVKKVADKLHNTAVVCKSNYLDPELIKLFTDKTNEFTTLFYSKNEKLNRDTIANQYLKFLKITYLEYFLIGLYVLPSKNPILLPKTFSSSIS